MKVRLRGIGASIGFTIGMSGCYTHVPLEPGAVQQGMSVRAFVTATASERIAPLLGTVDARRVAGTVISTAGDTLIVEVPTVARDETSAGVVTLHQRVSIERGEVLEIESRSLDRTRTGAVVGGAAILAGSVLLKALQNAPGKEKLPGGGETDAIAVLFRLMR